MAKLLDYHGNRWEGGFSVSLCAPLPAEEAEHLYRSTTGQNTALSSSLVFQNKLTAHLTYILHMLTHVKQNVILLI